LVIRKALVVIPTLTLSAAKGRRRDQSGLMPLPKGADTMAMRRRRTQPLNQRQAVTPEIRFSLCVITT